MPASVHRQLRLVLDTNIVMDALVRDGMPSRLMELAIKRETVVLFNSPVLRDDFAKRSGRAKLVARIDGCWAKHHALVAGTLRRCRS